MRDALPPTAATVRPPREWEEEPSSTGAADLGGLADVSASIARELDESVRRVRRAIVGADGDERGERDAARRRGVFGATEVSAEEYSSASWAPAPFALVAPIVAPPAPPPPRRPPPPPPAMTADQRRRLEEQRRAAAALQQQTLYLQHRWALDAAYAKAAAEPAGYAYEARAAAYGMGMPPATPGQAPTAEMKPVPVHWRSPEPPAAKSGGEERGGGGRAGTFATQPAPQPAPPPPPLLPPPPPPPPLPRAAAAASSSSHRAAAAASSSSHRAAAASAAAAARAAAAGPGVRHAADASDAAAAASRVCHAADASDASAAAGSRVRHAPAPGAARVDPAARPRVRVVVEGAGAPSRRGGVRRAAAA